MSTFQDNAGKPVPEYILHFIDAKDDAGGGDNWSYMTCKAPVKSSPTTNNPPVFYRPNALSVASQTN